MCESGVGGQNGSVRLALAGREVACRAIIFDKDGTLVDPTGLHSRLTRMRALRAAARAAVGPLQGVGSDLSRQTGPPGRASGLIGEELSENNRADVDCLADEVAMGIESDVDLGEWVPGPDLMPGVAEMLDAFQKLGLRMAVATGDRHRRAEATLHALGVDGRFSSIIGIDDVLFGKPAPDMVHLACERLGCSPDEVIVVGDSPADLMMGRAAGVAACIGVSAGLAASERLGALADAILPSAAALQDLLVR